jgi:hypothetical protein
MRPIVEYLDHQMINDLPPFTTINPSAEIWPDISLNKPENRCGR